MIESNLADVFTKKGLSISRVSRDTGISRTTLTALCKDKCKGIQFDTLDTLCSYLNVTPDEFLIHTVNVSDIIPEEKDVLKQAIETYGVDMQLNVAVEEFSELTKEICKHKRGANNTKGIVEEIADCYIMLRQLEMIFGIGSVVMFDEISRKKERLKHRLANHPTEKGGVRE